MPHLTLPTDTPRRRRAALLLCGVSLSALIVACGGGGAGSEPPSVQPAAVSTALYFTDDFSTRYDAVWVSINRVSAVNAAGTETQLLSFAPSLRLNLPQLRNAGSWAANAQIPADTVAIRVHVDPKAQLQKLDGSVMDVTLATPAGYLSFALEGWDRSSGVLALDFDLPRFTLQGSTLTAATRVASSEDLSRWNHREAEIKGTVSAASATSLTVDAGLRGTRVFAIDSNTSFVSLQSADWRPAVGDSVEVKASVAGQGSELQFTARVVKQRGSGEAAGTRAEVEGKVDAVQGNVVTLTVDDSPNGGPVGTLSLDLAAAVFKRGSLAAVQPGVRLEIYLVLQGQTWVARAVEIEGAAPGGNRGGDKPRRDYAELKGQVLSLSGSTLVLRPLNTTRFSAGLPAGDVTVDLGQAYFRKSSLSCLSAGTPVSFKGYVDAAGRFQAVVVEAEGACAAAVPVAGLKPPAATDASALNGKSVEAKGSITALRSGEFEIGLFRLSGLSKAPASAVVRYGSDTVFKDLSVATLAPGQFVEVKGVWQDGVISAVKIERD